MKSTFALVLTLVLTASTLAGCGCTKKNIDNTSAPTVLPTNEEIWNATENTSHVTTEHTTAPTTTENNNPNSDVTTEHGTGTTSTTDGTADTATETESSLSRSARKMIPGNR